MYPVSNAFLTAVKANNRKYYWTGRITTTAGTVYNFGQEDMVKGSGYITSQCCGSTEIELGTRLLKDNETDLLKEFLYEAIFIPEGVELPAREIIEQPELRIYYEDFGTGKADYCIVADDSGRVIGAVWTRIMNDYGHVDDENTVIRHIVIQGIPGTGHRNTVDEGDAGFAQRKGL